MAIYRVSYHIDVEADDLVQAAEQAQEYCLNSSFESRYWAVRELDGPQAEVVELAVEK